MTQKIEDLIKSFSNMTGAEMLDKIKHNRSARNIERPVAAAKRVKKAAKKSSVSKDKARDMFSNLSVDAQKALLKKLEGK